MIVNDWRRAILTSHLSPSARLVAFALSMRMNRSGECYPGVPKIAKDCGCSERTVQRAIAELRKNAYLLVTFRGKGPAKQQTNIYAARVPPWRTPTLRHDADTNDPWNDGPIPF